MCDSTCACGWARWFVSSTVEDADAEADAVTNADNVHDDDNRSFFGMDTTGILEFPNGKVVGTKASVDDKRHAEAVRPRKTINRCICRRRFLIIVVLMVDL
jgi:hypothetical protein